MRVAIMCKMTPISVRLNLKNFTLISCAILELLRKVSQGGGIRPPGEIGLKWLCYRGAGRICPPHVCVVQKTPCGIGLRAMTFSDLTAHSSPLFYDFKILQLICTSYQSRYLHMNAKTTLHHLISLTFSLKSANIHSYNTRSAARETFLSCKNTLQYGLRSICFNGAKIWNSIPPEIRDASSIRPSK